MPGHQNISRHIQDDEDIIDTDEEDEFFDAIEANMLPNLLVSQYHSLMYVFYSNLDYHLWKAFDINSNVSGACGEIVVSIV